MRGVPNTAEPLSPKSFLSVISEVYLLVTSLCCAGLVQEPKPGL